ncbi:DUF72 domain-containing protein [Bacillus sp. HC-TM]
MIYIGLPQWSHPKWVRLGITSLEEYARHFNCVEGNTTLYALPKPEVVLRWREQTTDDFRFCFKFPATISHQAALRHCDDLVTEFLTRMSPLAPRIGQYWLQLPATFGPRELPALWHFLDSLPGEFNYGVEVRHPQFFAKGEEEQTLNRGLHQRGVNRVILDSRPVLRHIITTDKTDQRICRRQYSMYRNFRFFSLSVANSFTVWTCCMNRAAV